MSDELIHKLGKVIEGDAVEFRDAVHVAVAPVVAGEKLWPSQKIEIDGGTKCTAMGSEHPIGIVDPFLSHQVNVGDRFWMWLKPGTITSLRHEWEHPAFSVDSSVSVDDDEVLKVAMTWMIEFAAQHQYYPNYYTKGEEPVQHTAEQLVEAGREFLLSGDRYVQRGSESLRNHFPTEFWAHFSAITGMEVPDYKKIDNPFCCTC